MFRGLMTRILGSSTVEHRPVKSGDAGSTPAPGAHTDALSLREHVAELVPSQREQVVALLTTGQWEPPTNYIRAEVVGKAAVSDALAAATNRDLMARERARDIDRNRTAYPMRGRFHCCEPKLLYAIDLGLDLEKLDMLELCMCELCGWEFKTQRYITGPDALPPPSADCFEAGATRRLPRGH